MYSNRGSTTKGNTNKVILVIDNVHYNDTLFLKVSRHSNSLLIAVPSDVVVSAVVRVWRMVRFGDRVRVRNRARGGHLVLAPLGRQQVI